MLSRRDRGNARHSHLTFCASRIHAQNLEDPLSIEVASSWSIYIQVTLALSASSFLPSAIASTLVFSDAWPTTARVEQLLHVHIDSIISLASVGLEVHHSAQKNMLLELAKPTSTCSPPGPSNVIHYRRCMRFPLQHSGEPRYLEKCPCVYSKSFRSDNESDAGRAVGVS